MEKNVGSLKLYKYSILFSELQKGLNLCQNLNILIKARNNLRFYVSSVNPESFIIEVILTSDSY